MVRNDREMFGITTLILQHFPDKITEGLIRKTTHSVNRVQRLAARRHGGGGVKKLVITNFSEQQSKAEQPHNSTLLKIVNSKCLTCLKKGCIINVRCAGVAQSVEQLIRNEQVGGSSPFTSSQTAFCFSGMRL